MMKMNKKISKNKNTKDDLLPLHSSQSCGNRRTPRSNGRRDADDACSTDLILPDKDVGVQILRDLRKLIFPGHWI